MDLRRTVECVIRGFAILLCIAAVVLVVSRVLLLIEYGYTVAALLRESLRIHAEEVRWAIPFVVVAVLLWILQKPLSRLIVPRRPAGGVCPECGYSLRQFKGSRCPECGTSLPSQTKTVA